MGLANLVEHDSTMSQLDLDLVNLS